MGAIWTIAVKDLKSYLYSVKGAAIIFFFLFFLGLFFSFYVGEFMRGQMQAAQHGGGGPTLEMLLRALFSNIHFILFITIPAITMSAFAGERRTQSIRLLLNAPITSNQIVLGKYLSLLLFMGLVLLAAMVYPFYTILYGNPDKGVIFSAYLGVFLLMASQLAFGLWISSFVNNQFVAFMFTILGLFLFLILGWIVESQLASGWLQDTLKYISSTEHLDSFLRGTISIKSLCYFLVMGSIFLFLTTLSIDSMRWR